MLRFQVVIIFLAVVNFCGADNTTISPLEFEENGSTMAFSWTTNVSLGLTDRMRTYGKGFYLTAKEEVALDKLRPLVKEYASLSHPFERRDNVLIKFLRARNLDVQAAAEMYRAAMAWRKERDLNKMLNTDYNRWEKLFPFVVSGLDKHNGPIYYILAAAYDVRKSILGGHYQTLIDLFDRSFELGIRAGVAIYETRGENAGFQGILIMDMAGFNIKQHGCAQCLSIYVHVVTAYERYWPQTLRKLFMVNTPRAFEVVLEVVRPLMSKYTSEMLEVYGYDRNEWLPVLSKYIDEDQLLVRYGGTRKLSTFSSQTYGG